MPPDDGVPARLPDDGVLVGWSSAPEPSRRPFGFGEAGAARRRPDGPLEPILFDGEGHLMTIAPTGAGKGVGCIVPALLRYPGPVIVIDPKGENVAITARRRRAMGQQVVVIDPMGVTGEPSGTLNPLDAIDVGRIDAVDDVAALAGSLGSASADERNVWWRSRGEHLLIGLMLDALTEAAPARPSLIDLRDRLGLVCAQPGEFGERLLGSRHPEVRRIAQTLAIGAPETLGGIIAFAQEMVDFLRGDALATSLGRTSFALDDVTLGAPLSIYLVLPPHLLESHGRLLRLWLVTLMSRITRRRSRPERSTLFLLDEAAQLGELPALRQAMTLLRGYGVQTWSFWQDPSQLRLLYPRDWRTMVSNCRVVQCFGASSRIAAEAMEELIGRAKDADLLDLPPEDLMLQIAGSAARSVRRPDYRTDAAFAGWFDPNPFYEGGPILPRPAAAQPMIDDPAELPAPALERARAGRRRVEVDPLLERILAKGAGVGGAR